MASVTAELADLRLEEEEEEVAIAVSSDSEVSSISFEFCFVGSFFTSSVVNFQSMRATLASVWHPIDGIAISDLGDGRYLFRLYNAIDSDRIEVEGPWTRTDLKKPLKRRKKILLPNGTSAFVSFQYEKLKLFCFRCGKLGHGEGFCPLRVMIGDQDVPFQWDASIRAPVRRRPPPFSPWLREEDGGSLHDSLANPYTNQGMGNLRNQSQIVSYEQIAEKWDVVALKGKLTTATNVKSIPMNIPRRGRAHNLSNKPNNLPVDMAIDQGEEDNPIICQDGLKRPRNVPTSSVHLPHSISDHCPLLLITGSSHLPRRHWHFKFEASWILESSYESEVKRLWESSTGFIPDRLKVVRMGLDYWYWKLRAARKHKRRNTIRFLEDAHGSGTESEQRFQEIAQEYFSSLFTSDYSKNCSSILNGIHPTVDDAMNTSLLADFQKADVLNAVKSMGPMKVAGEDGLGAIFYQ
ncbi:hypothetical protein V6N11_075270 [Hibiscus sabdariffa]|uniref:CCHC-type domain-containing protein n=1 Tax=Hibiscus sabdariffa TaxID=183260 RepID=A0ABR2R617_9ROSI